MSRKKPMKLPTGMLFMDPSHIMAIGPAKTVKRFIERTKRPAENLKDKFVAFRKQQELWGQPDWVHKSGLGFFSLADGYAVVGAPVFYRDAGEAAAYLKDMGWCMAWEFSKGRWLKVDDLEILAQRQAKAKGIKDGESRA